MCVSVYLSCVCVYVCVQAGELQTKICTVRECNMNRNKQKNKKNDRQNQPQTDLPHRWNETRKKSHTK